MPSWFWYRNLIDDILERNSHKWGTKVEDIVKELCSPFTYTFIPKSIVSYVSSKKYMITLSSLWKISLKVINTHYEVAPSKSDFISCLVYAKQHNKYGISLHMFTSLAKEWISTGEPQTGEDKYDEYSVFFTVTKIENDQEKDAAISLFNDYGLAANLLLNKFNFSQFVEWEKKHNEKYRRDASPRTEENYECLRNVWKKWYRLNNTEKYIKILADMFELKENDNIIVVIQKIVQLNSAIASNIIDMVRIDPYCMHDMLPATFTISKCHKIATKIGMADDNPYHVIRLMKYTLNKQEMNGHSFVNIEDVTEYWTDSISKCYETALGILEGKVILDKNYPGPMTIIMPSQKSNKDDDDSISKDLYGGCIQKTIGNIKNQFHLDKTGLTPRLYRLNVWKTQCEYLAFLKTHITLKPISYPASIVERAMTDFEEYENVLLTEEQRCAVLSAVSNPVTIITGEAGSGKTTVIKAIIRVLTTIRLLHCTRDVCKDFLCMAPTGKAARVFKDKTEQETYTIDSFMINSNNCDFVEKNFTTTPVIIIDEMSMVSLRHTRVFQKIVGILRKNNDLKRHTCDYKFETDEPVIDRVILIGDISQLPPIGAGDVFHDTIQIIQTERETNPHLGADVVCLKGSKRIDASSSIIYKNVNLLRTERKRKGVEDIKTVEIFPRISITQFVQEKDIFEIYETSVDDIDSSIMQNALDIIKKEKEHGWNRGPPTPFHTMQILTDTNAKRHVININIQKALHSESVITKNTNFIEFTNSERAYVGDKIMVCDNALDMGVVNGDIGWVVEIIDPTNIKILLEHGSIVKINLLKVRVTLAYAITVHKSQGSEFPYVVCVFYKQFRHTTRALLYTALTRGRKRVRVISTKDGFSCAMNNETEQRNSDAYRNYFSVVKKPRVDIK